MRAVTLQIWYIFQNNTIRKLVLYIINTLSFIYTLFIFCLFSIITCRGVLNLILNHRNQKKITVFKTGFKFIVF